MPGKGQSLKNVSAVQSLALGDRVNAQNTPQENAMINAGGPTYGAFGEIDTTLSPAVRALLGKTGSNSSQQGGL